MGIPVPSIFQRDLGRFWEATITVFWDAEDDQNLVGEGAVRVSALSGILNNHRLAVTDLAWNANLTGTVVFYYDSSPMAASNDILTISKGGTNGEIHFAQMSIDGTKSDPNRSAPGNIVMNSTGAGSGDDPWIRMR